MPTNKHTRSLASLAGLLVLASGAASLIGCASGSPPPEISSVEYDGPPIDLANASGHYLVVVRPTSPGWSVRLDRVLEGHGFHSAFVSIGKPNPAYSYPPTPVVQNLATNVATVQPLRVFARHTDWNGKSPTGDEYSPVAVNVIPLTIPTPAATPPAATPPAPPPAATKPTNPEPTPKQ